MEHAFWHERWAENRIGFHEGRANRMLTAHLADLGLAPGARIFLPLCGKTRDIPWLMAQGHPVAGAELSETAVRQLFDEMKLVPEITGTHGGMRFAAPGVDVFVGDIFDLDAETLGPVDAIFDRAALVALPTGMRDRYAAHLMALTGTAPQLLVTFEYDQSAMDGPPFSVTEAMARDHYGADYTIDVLERVDLGGGLRGKVDARETAWKLVPRDA
ncbi:thiopurine S-methyltransferase [Oceaniglobus roseus]|uniref:thiopurine S-methyltransferase n=1 Tax=Oceaniglobus roseus TaxID=1737570 RepID=UPI000C7F6A84|nr:thiopurine S-methyltransferase [Kandeliimicrobium roseum]